MQLLVIRHAIAEEREDFAATGRDDSERPLTSVGRQRMRRGAQGLGRIAPGIDVLASSPYVRALETARIVAESLGIETGIITLNELTPEESPEAILPWLKKQPRGATVAIVGHEPHLGHLVTWLMAGGAESSVEFKKGGACLLDLGERPFRGGAVLRWLLTPSQLRGLAD